MTLKANPTNYFAETEQVAFHPGHLVPGIDVTNDPLLQVRLFSYLDTQISRLGGPNFAQLPINRPQAPVNDMLRDGMHQQAVHGGAAPYHPNSLDGGCPFLAGQDVGAFIDVPEELAASIKERKNPASFSDHYSQVRLFFRSLTPAEQDHIIQAYTFELGKCFEKAIRERQLLALANVDTDLCAAVAKGLGMPAPAATEDVPDSEPSPALSQLGKSWPVAGRVVGIVADQGSDFAAVNAARKALDAQGIVPLVIAPAGGYLGAEADGGVPVQRTYLTARSTEFDAIIVAGAAEPAPDASPGRDAKAGEPGASAVDPRVVLMLSEAFRHAKALGVWGQDSAALDAAGIPPGAAGIVSADGAEELVAQLAKLLANHRVWERFPADA
jgi:catalase